MGLSSKNSHSISSDQGERCRRCPPPLMRRRRRREHSSIFISALLSLALSSSSQSASAARAPRTGSGSSTADVSRRVLNVTAYYGPHRFHDRNGLSKPENLDYTKVTRIIYGPFQINERGSIWGTDVNADPQLLFGPPNWNPPKDASLYCHQTTPDMQPQCGYHHYEKGLVGRAHANDVEVYASIGGKEWSDKFSELASDPEARKEFAVNAALLIMYHDFDGLDIAWQFPQSPDDMANYSLLLNEVRLALDQKGQTQGRTFGLTAALPCTHDNLEHIDIPTLDSVLSEFNLFSFDFHGPWDGRVGVNSALYDVEGHSIDGCVTNYLNGGASRDKINVGLAFYGHSYRGGRYIGDQCDRNWAGVCGDHETWPEDDGSPQYHNIYSEIPEMTLSFDLQTMTPLAYNHRGVVSFDDPYSICLKTEYTDTNELNGLVIMDLAADMLDDKSTPLLDAVNLKILQPSINCRGDTFKELFEWREVSMFNPHGNNGVSSSSNGKVSDAEEEGPTHRYICGTGEGNAEESCNKEGMDAISCDHGFCPQEDMSCYVVPCSRSRDAGASFSKTKPRPKPRPTSAEVPKLRPTSVDEENPQSGGRSRENQQMVNSKEAAPPVREITRPVETGPGRAPTFSFSCGSHFDHAKSCGKPCPNGLTDCPSGQFCFWLECDPPVSVSTEAKVASPTVLATEIKYQCGRNRDEAMTCSEDCGFAWQCPFGKDCYSVPCSS